jgi:predicted RecB family nuclease
LPSFSLKVVERHVGFARTIPDASGDWAMAKYVEAVETEDEAKRQALIDEICAYNHEDLEATWAVFKWLRSLP